MFTPVEILRGKWKGVMSKEELRDAERSRERIVQTRIYPDIREETEESVEKGRELHKKIKKERKIQMTEKEKRTQKAEAKAKAPAKPKGPKYPNKDRPPQVEKGMRAVWHDPYTYKNAKDNMVTIQGHYEVIKAVEKKVEVEKKPAEEES